MTDKVDSMPAAGNSQSGVERLRSRRSRFIRYTALAFLAAMAIGFAGGYGAELVQDGILPVWVLITGWAIAMVGYAWFTRDFMRRVDEVDLLDNLWATFTAFYFYVVAYLTWVFFHQSELVGEPSQPMIFIATMAVLLIAYGARKLGLR